MYNLDGVALSGSLLASLLNEAASPYAGSEPRKVSSLPMKTCFFLHAALAEQRCQRVRREDGALEMQKYRFDLEALRRGYFPASLAVDVLNYPLLVRGLDKKFSQRSGVH